MFQGVTGRFGRLQRRFQDVSGAFQWVTMCFRKGLEAFYDVSQGYDSSGAFQGVTRRFREGS